MKFGLIFTAAISVIYIMPPHAECAIYSTDKNKLEQDTAEATYPLTQPELPRAAKGKEWKEVPFISSNPIPSASAEENERGYILFSRPLIEPVYPGSRPLDAERLLDGLSLFITPGELETTSFSIYPLRKFADFNVYASELKDASGKTIPGRLIDVRLVTCWKLKYPEYRSDGTWRMMPELLEKVSRNSFAAGSCQRYWITVKSPEDCAPGIYSGNIYLAEACSSKAVVIPLTVRVLNFQLLSPPDKNYSAFDKDIHRNFKNIKSGNPSAHVLLEWESHISNYYQQMRNCGMTNLTVAGLTYDKKSDSFNVEFDGRQIDAMRAAGLKGPVPVMMLGANAQLLHDKYNIEYHEIRRQEVKFPEAFYEDMTKLTRKLEQHRKSKGWPEFIYAPFDEIKQQHLYIGVKSYQALKNVGVKTFITKDPTVSSLALKSYGPYVDIWCSQPFSLPPVQASMQKYGIWSYPNHIAGEIRQPEVMTVGGRMTYGLGFWKSGYSTLMPWIWHARNKNGSPFDFISREACLAGNVVGPDGKFYPAVYWICFREGRDDLRYIYTLMQTVYDKESCNDRKCRELCGEARNFLEKVWNALPVEPMYLYHNSWTAMDYLAVRSYAACLIEQLMKFPGKSEVPVHSTSGLKLADSFMDSDSRLSAALKSGSAGKVDLTAPAYKWEALNNECSMSRKNDSLILDFDVDHKVDGEIAGGKYPIGWPRVKLDLPDGNINMAKYDFLNMDVNICSNRDEIQDDRSSLFLTLNTTGGSSCQLELLGSVAENKILKIIVPVKDIIEKLKPVPINKNALELKKIQLVLAESNYLDKTKIKFEISSLAFVKITSTILLKARHPVFIPENTAFVPVELDVLGNAEYNTEIILQNAGSEAVAGRTGVICRDNKSALLLKTEKLSPGGYDLIIKLNGKIADNTRITVLPSKM